jgi:hypothetical protein
MSDELVTLDDIAQRVASAEDMRRMSDVLVAKLPKDDVRRVLDEATFRPLPLDEASFLVTLQCWSRMLDDRLDDWVFACTVVHWINSLPSFQVAQSLRLANRLAWLSSGDPTLPRAGEWPHGTSEAAQHFLVGLYCNRPRFLFQYNRLDSVLDALQVAEGPDVVDWPLTRSFRAFEILGQRPSLTEEGRRLARDAWADVEFLDAASDRSAVLDIVLHALDSAAHASQVAQDVLDVCASLSHAEKDPVVLFRLCKARSRLADSYRVSTPKDVQFMREKALDDVQQALHRLRGDNDFTRFFGEQLRMQREQVLAARDMDEVFLRIGEAEEVMCAAESFVKEESRASAIRSTEILALFSSAVAFAVGAAAIGANATSAWASVAIGVALAVGLLGFSALLLVAGRLSIDPTLPSRRSASVRSFASQEDRHMESPAVPRWLVLTVLLSSVVSVAALLVALVISPRLSALP